MVTTRLQAIRGQTNALAQNRMLFEALKDDEARAALYEDLRREDFPPLKFKSVLPGEGDTTGWPDQDVYLLTSRRDIENALKYGSVQPYSELESGGKFMLGMEKGDPHTRQRSVALKALQRNDEESIAACIHEAISRTMVLPAKLDEFDLVTHIGEQSALRLMSLVFGLPARSHVVLELAMRATYQRLTFQIIGRHFVANDGLPPPDSARARDVKQKLEEHVFKAAKGEDFPEWWDEPLRHAVVSRELAGIFGPTDETTRIVILGLIAGTIGNVSSAIANTVDYFFRTPDNESEGDPLIDRATRHAKKADPAELDEMIDQALRRRPPAPFLARTAKADFTPQGGTSPLPAGTHLLLALGADVPCDPELLFGGALGDTSYVHSCVGRHLALPLVRETVRQVLRLPGLTRAIDPATGLPKALVKQWGAICKSFPLRFQRDRRMNQQPLFLVLPIKAPLAENVAKLEELTRAGAPVIERALSEARNVHFAWFGLVENKTHLAMFTVYDGDFDAYVEHFALKVPLFNEQFRYLEGAPPTPVREYPKEFVEFIRSHNRSPVAKFFYSAYPRASVADIHNAGLGQP